MATLADTEPSLQRSADIADTLSVAQTGPDSIERNADGAVLTYIRVADTSAATLEGLRAAGATIVHVASAYNIVTAYVAPNHLRATAAESQVANIQEVLSAEVDGAGIAHATTPQSQQAACPSGVVSEGDVQLKAAAARAAFNIDGSGVTVGVLSDSYNVVGTTNAANDVAAGELPGTNNPCGYTTPVSVVAESPATTATDEGRAMLHIVHDLAPGANLAFATTSGGMFAFADNIRKLKSAGANVIVDDVGYLQEPLYQDGPISVAVSDVSAQGAMYFKSVGNTRLLDSTGHSIGSYEAAYRGAPCLFAGMTTIKSTCHAFDAATNDTTMGISLSANGSFTLVLQWAQPWYGVTTDLDLFLLDQQSNVLAKSTTNNTGVNGTQMPYESMTYVNKSGAAQQVNLVIASTSGPPVQALKYVLSRASGVTATEYNTTNSEDTFGPSVVGHAMAAEALSVGAVRYNNSSAAESFSSRGPATIYFAPVRNTTASTTLATPDVRNKPDLLATNGGRNTFFGALDAGTYRFYGTSAAAPHAAAVAALMQQHAIQTETLFSTTIGAALLKETASYVTPGTAQDEPGGLVNAFEATYTLAPPTETTTFMVYIPTVVK